MSPPSQQYLPRPQLTPYVYDYEEVINGLTFYTRVHQAEYTVAHYTAYVKPGVSPPRNVQQQVDSKG